MEFVDLEICSYDSILNRKNIELIGYEISKDDLEKNKNHKFIFDKYSRLTLEKIHHNKKIAKFLIKPTTAIIENHIIKWFTNDEENHIKLVINYITKKRNKISKIENIKYVIENNKIKLTWTNPENEDFVGAYVVRNRFHIPMNILDGDKIYAGRDSYTIDEFGNNSISKYYSIFAYNNVPIYSDISYIYYDSSNIIQ